MNGTETSLEKTLYGCINTLLISCLLIFNFGKRFGIMEPSMSVVLLLVGFSLFVFGICYSFEKKKGMTVLIVFVMSVGLMLVIGIDTIVEFVLSYVQWLLNGEGWKNEWINGYQLLQLFFVVLVSGILQWVLESFLYVKFVVGIGVAGALLYGLFSKQELSYVGVVFSLSFLGLLFIQWTEIYWEKEKQRNVKTYMLWMVPFMVAFWGLMIQMPVPEEPYDWSHIKKAVHYCEEQIKMVANNLFRKEEKNDFFVSGFSEQGGIGAGVVLDDNEIMTITSNKYMKTNLYLTGKIFNTFENMEWSSTQSEDVYDRALDTMETLCAVVEYDEGYMHKYLQSTELTICYKDVKTKHLFTPGKTYSVTNDEKPIDYDFLEGSAYFRETYKYGSDYKIDYYQMNYDSEAFNELLHAEIVRDEDLWEKTLNEFHTRTGVRFDREYIENYQKQCYEEYMGVPKLSKKTIDYVNELTKDCESDVETLWAIENELSTYQYNTKPGTLPEYVVDASTFLDYFLLESKQGYCTYYATAFVLLARANGFPARYVQGYCVPMQGMNQTTVLSSMAHAWPEVYVEGLGWVAFEPTPGYRKMRYSPWNTKKFTYSHHENEAAYRKEETTANEVEYQKTLHRNTVMELWNKAGYFLLFLIAGCSVVIVLGTIVNQIRYHRCSVEERYRLKMKRNIKLLSVVGITLTSTETLSEYMERGKEKIGDFVTLDFVTDYENVIYGGSTVTEDMMNDLDQVYQQMIDVIKGEKSIKFVIYRLRKILSCDVI